MKPAFILSIALLLPALIYAQESPAKKEVAEPYPGFRDDQALLRKQFVLAAPKGLKASSPEAISAAHRIFSRVSFLFQSRAEVLETLGDPATISDYNSPASKEPGSALVYVFSNGLGGWQYTIGFDKLRPDIVIEIKAESQN
jgi:hypothetical protein